MKTYLVTGGAGFIGSNFIHYMFEKYDNDIRIINVDVLTYAGNLENLKGVDTRDNYTFVKADITDKDAIEKIFSENEISFHKLFDCHIYAYVAKNHPLAKKKRVTLEELSEYPCLAFDQGENNSFYFAEELYSTYNYKRIIHASDRATMLNLFIGMNGFTLCSGIICEDLNGDDYRAVRLDNEDLMTIGYIKRKGIPLSPIGQKYIEEVEKYKEMILD